MIYIVSGFMRSGTSMLMDALSAGGRPNGLRVEWSRERDEAMNRRHAKDGFTPNESYREVALTEYADFDFPLKYDGALIKVMSWGLSQMRRVPHVVAFMLREPAEIAESYERAFGQPLTIHVDGVTQRADQAPDVWASQYRAAMKQAIIAAETRADCHKLIVLDYDDVLANPRAAMRRLSAHFPIDVSLAEAVIDRRRKRAAA